MALCAGGLSWWPPGVAFVSLFAVLASIAVPTPRLNRLVNRVALLAVRAFKVHGAHFWAVLGQVFNYTVYHDQVLTQIRKRYRAIPASLPQRGGDFCAPYFPEHR